MMNTAEDLRYQIKNILLAYPSDWYIQKDTFEAVKESILIDWLGNRPGNALNLTGKLI